MTFAELQAHLNALRFQRTVLTHLMEHLDAEFMPVLDGAPKKVLLTDDKVKVPAESFDQVVVAISNWIKELKKQEDQYSGAPLTFGQAIPPQASQTAALTVESKTQEAPPQPTPAPEVQS